MDVQGGPVGELLDVAVERSPLEQLEFEVGRAGEDRNDPFWPVITGKRVSPDDVYVDDASLATFSNVVGAVDTAAASHARLASSSTPTSPYSHAAP